MASNRLLSRNIEKANRGPKSLGKQGSHTGVTSNVGDDRTRIFYKTKMCAFWQVGRCQRGAACKYAHGDQELNNEPDLQKTAMCPKMIRGRGCRDPQCSFAHDVHELRSRDECPKTPMGAYVEILKRCRDLDAHTEQLCSNDEVILAASDKGLRGACSDDGDLQTEFEFAVHPAFERSVTMPTAADFERTNDPGKDLRVSPAGDNDFLYFQTDFQGEIHSGFHRSVTMPAALGQETIGALPAHAAGKGTCAQNSGIFPAIDSSTVRSNFLGGASTETSPTRCNAESNLASLRHLGSHTDIPPSFLQMNPQQNQGHIPAGKSAACQAYPQSEIESASCSTLPWLRQASAGSDVSLLETPRSHALPHPNLAQPAASEFNSSGVVDLSLGRLALAMPVVMLPMSASDSLGALGGSKRAKMMRW